MRSSSSPFRRPSNLPVWVLVASGLIGLVPGGLFTGVNLMIGSAPSRPCNTATTVCGPEPSAFFTLAGIGALVALFGLILLVCGLVLLGRRSRLRFNPAPGWPPLPPGWTPYPGWQPPDEWPQAPSGWPWWIKSNRGN